MGFVCLMPYLFINKVAIFQPLYFIIFFVKDFQPYYIIFFYILQPYLIISLLYLVFLICGPIALYKLIFKVIWSFDFIFRHSCYIFIYFLSLVSAFVPYLLFQVFFPPPKGFVFINLPIHPPVCAFVGIFNPIDNQVESIKREDFIKIKGESFGIFIFITPQPYQGVKSIIKKVNQSKIFYLFLVFPRVLKVNRRLFFLPLILKR